jgi:hypothetical protein
VAATAIAGLRWVLFCASVLMIGRSFWVLYVQKVRSPVTVVVSWMSLVFMVGLWTWFLATYES